ncbi:MAG: hypothetical protein Q8P76_02320 [bacterium]|nr:hypothetical protein [bacterium]
MKERIIEKQLAIKLRKSGRSYNEIRSRIPNLSKGTLSGWLKYISLTPGQLNNLEKRINSKMDKARFKAAISNRKKRIQRTKAIFKEASSSLAGFITNPLFIIGLSLYWAEGSKRGGNTEIINSDPMIIKIMINWFNKFLDIPREKMKFRLYIHKPYADEKLEKYWSQGLKISLNQFQSTVYKFTPYNFKKIPDYKGCLRLYVGGINHLRKILGWQKLFVKTLQIK